MANCLTSERHGGVLAALKDGATSFDEIAARLPVGTGHERLTMLLGELHDAGFVVRSTRICAPIRGAYRLTADGQKLVDLTTFVSSWLSRKDEDGITESFWTNLRMTAQRVSERASAAWPKLQA